MIKKHFQLLITSFAALVMLVSLAAPVETSAVLIPGAGSGGGEDEEGIELNIGQEAVDEELPGTANVDLDDQSSGFAYWFNRLLVIAMVVASVMVLINLLLGAFKWITSGGDTGKVQEAQKQILNAIIGLIVLAAIVAVFELLTGFLEIEIITFSGGE